MPKEVKGKNLKNYFCGDCGCPLWGIGGFGPNLVVRAGILDGNGLENAKPQLEVFAERRLTWLTEVEGAQSVEGMGNSQEGAS